MNIMFKEQLIKDYINGEDIKEYALEELENNYDFMLSVIKYTNDKKIYNLCSKNLKNNYGFIKEIIILFKYDFNFINKIAEIFIENNKPKENIINIAEYKETNKKTKETEIFELNILMSNIYRKYYPDEFNKYALNVTLFKESILIENEIFIKENKDWIKDVGLGFELCSLAFDNSEEIIKIFAEYYINEIFYNENLEEFLHQNFNKEDILKVGSTSFIINYINNYDQYLASYIINNKHIINRVKKDIEKILNNWNIYNEYIEKQQYNIFIDKLLKYKEENFMNMLYSLDELIDFISSNLHLEKIFNTYYFRDEIYSEEDIFYDNLFKKDGINIEKLNKEELSCLKKVYSFAKKIFKEKTIEDIEIDDKIIYIKKTKSI